MNVRALTRKQYAELRSGYRAARKADARWSPSPHAARNTVQTPPRHSARFAVALPAELVATFLKPFTVHGRLPRGTRAEAIYTRWCRKQLSASQIGLRNGLVQMDALRKAAA